ncbi:MAG: aromatic ring-hydroxylating dioxygenase subunit alpha [Gemmataceae bacterium]
MFVHQHQLEHLLTPADYVSADAHTREMERLFRPGWYPLASRTQLPREGDFITLELLGEPLLARRVGESIRAYLNVCPHRHARLCGQARGHAPTLRCQYHGWEYQADGRTARIPDARCFRPFDREQARLVQFRTASWGDLTFVSLADAGPSLADFLGTLAAEEAHWLAPPFELAWTWSQDYPANWKVVVENTLESYHIDCLHRKTLGRMPTEEECNHDLQEEYTRFVTPETIGWVSRMQNLLVGSLGGTITNRYTHHHVHPHLWVITMDVMRMVQSIEPLTPTTSRHRVWVYTLRGQRRNPWAWLVKRLLRWIVVDTARRILREDASIFPEIQAGLARSRFVGCIGTREERVYAFQRFVRQRVGESAGSAGGQG